ncbi:MAG: 2-amino-4-hydroxy-6-hydroxymethyldihydropteridine diphosphokinase, partial [Actinobacteria bacterium]
MAGTAGQTGLLGLGSNIGERRVNLQAAVDALPEAGVEVLASSSTYDTDPVGEVLDQPSFLNACLLVRTTLEPLPLLDAVKRLERELGRRDPARRHGPRTIDIDILLLGQ